MSDYQKHKKMLLKNLLDSLVEYGFDKKVYDQSFQKPISGGKAMIHIAFIKHIDDFDVTVSVSIRFDELEKMIWDFMQNNVPMFKYLSKGKGQEKTSTLGTELGNFSEGAQKRWKISCEADVDTATKSMIQTIINVAFPYIEKYKSMECAYDIASRDDREAMDHMLLHNYRAMNAVGLAVILNRVDEIDELVQKKN